MDGWPGLARSLAGVDDPGLAVALERFHDLGRRRWSCVPVLAPADLVSHLALHLPPGGDRAVELAKLAAEDLYLACACLLELPGAAKELDEHFIARVPLFVAHIDSSRAFADEIAQQLRVRLLVQEGERRPRIADYSGRGSLVGWLRVIAVRLALNQVAGPDVARRVDDAVALDELAEDDSAELRLLRAQFGAALTAALRRAISALAPEQRVLLRLHFSTGHSTHTIAAMLHVNQSTAARRLMAARQAVYEETRRLLVASVPMTTTELASLARALESQLNFSLTSLLAEPPK
jgi:RNA polymerase sigma-70 factor